MTARRRRRGGRGRASKPQGNPQLAQAVIDRVRRDAYREEGWKMFGALSDADREHAADRGEAAIRKAWAAGDGYPIESWRLPPGSGAPVGSRVTVRSDGSFATVETCR